MIVNIWKYFPLYSHILRTIGKSFKEKARLIYLSTYHKRGVRGQTLFLEVRPRLNFKGLAKNKKGGMGRLHTLLFVISRKALWFNYSGKSWHIGRPDLVELNRPTWQWPPVSEWRPHLAVAQRKAELMMWVPLSNRWQLQPIAGPKTTQHPCICMYPQAQLQLRWGKLSVVKNF